MIIHMFDTIIMIVFINFAFCHIYFYDLCVELYLYEQFWTFKNLYIGIKKYRVRLKVRFVISFLVFILYTYLLILYSIKCYKYIHILLLLYIYIYYFILLLLYITFKELFIRFLYMHLIIENSAIFSSQLQRAPNYDWSTTRRENELHCEL